MQKYKNLMPIQKPYAHNIFIYSCFIGMMTTPENHNILLHPSYFTSIGKKGQNYKIRNVREEKTKLKLIHGFERF